MIEKQHRNISIDIAKGIGIILVVLGHTKGPKELINFIYCFHMPLFFFISGYLFNFDKWSNRFSEFIKTRINRLIIPYFVMSLCFFYPFWFVLGRKFGEGKDLNIVPIKDFIGIFYGSAVDHYMDFNTPLWFLLCLFISEIIFFFILKKFKKSVYRIFSVIVISLMGYYISKYYALPWSFDVAMVVQLFFFTGYYMKKKNVVLTSFSGIISLIIFVYIVNQFGRVDTATRGYGSILAYYMGGISGTLFTLWISQLISNVGVLAKKISFFGMQSMSVFMWHNLGFKVASIIFVYIIGMDLKDAHVNHYFIYTLISIAFTLIVLFIRNCIQNILIKYGYNKISNIINW